MGLIKAALDAAGSTLGDQWLEYFYCDSIDKDVLVVKGQKQTKGSNKGSDNIISNGSGIAVADGQCMIIVDDGKVVEICAEPGKFTYDASSEPSIFSGSLGSSIIESFKTFGKRFAMGGNTGHDQRVYYFNTKEITENKFGTPNPIPFRVVDSKIMLDIDVSLRCSGLYSYKIVDPILFYTNVCGNVASQYNRSEIDGQLKTEFISALTPSIGKLSDLEIRPNQIVSHSTDLENNLNEALSMKWYQSSQRCHESSYTSSRGSGDDQRGSEKRSAVILQLRSYPCSRYSRRRSGRGYEDSGRQLGRCHDRIPRYGYGS